MNIPSNNQFPEGIPVSQHRHHTKRRVWEDTMKKRIRTTALIACGALSLTAVQAQADLTFTKEAYLGWGNAGDHDGALGVLTLGAAGEQHLDGGAVITYRGQLRLRSDQHDIGDIDSHPVDVELGLDLQEWGKLSFTTFSDHGHFPWADGEIMNRGDVAVFPDIAPRYRPVGGISTFHGSDFFRAEGDSKLTYENHIGAVQVKLIADPVYSYGGMGRSKTDAAGFDDLPRAEARLVLPTAHGIFSLDGNDLGDIRYSAIFPIHGSGVTFIAGQQVQAGDWAGKQTDLILDFKAPGDGLFKGVWAIYSDVPDDYNALVSVRFGRDAWEASAAVDEDGDAAIEGSYKVNKMATLYAGWDSGHAAWQGFDFNMFPPPSAAARGAAVEIGLRMTF
jgi:hypothetical protein